MSDPSKPKPPSIPTWQRQQQPLNSGVDDEVPLRTPNTPSEAPWESSPRNSLLQKAAKFLEDDEIRAASNERKASFLEDKGLTSDEVQQLLETAADKGGTEPVSEQAQNEQQDAPQSPSSSSPSPESKDLSSGSPKKDIPPIITYPEHLFQPPASPPIVTLSRLLNTAYVLSSAAAMTYGTSKYIIEPMLSSLARARHELFEAASANTNTLNTKLEEAVSTIPDNANDELRNTRSEEEVDRKEQDGDQIAATAFFHREIGTQTSPHLSRANSPSSTTSSQPPPSPTSIQTTQLINLQDQLKTLIPPPPPSQANAPHTDDDDSNPSSLLKQELSHFKTYLKSLLQGGSSAGATASSTKKDAEDPIWSVRTELRLAKGALLSSKNFPAAGGRGMRSTAAG